MRRGGIVGALLLGSTALAASPAWAQDISEQPVVADAEGSQPDPTPGRDTLREALVDAYQSNPTLTAERARLRSTDAGVAIARAGSRPQVSAVAGVNRDLTRQGILNQGGSNDLDLSVGVDLSYPLFQGGRVRNDIRAAETRVEAGRAQLDGVEGDVFVQATTAYMDVILNRALVDLNANQVRVLSTNLEASRDRFEIGDLTRTDVAQSEARFQLAQSNLATAEGRLTGAEENYRRIIGNTPGDLAPPPPLPPLPETPEEAVQIALLENPDFQAATLAVEAAGYDVNVVSASRLPTVSAVGSGTYINGIGGSGIAGVPSSGTQTQIGVQGRIPIYQGGLPAARIAQARAFESQLLEQQVATQRFTVAETRSAFASYEAALEAIAANEVAVEANELALEGARLENSIGNRSVLFVLDAEQELLQARTALVTARRDAYVAGFRLLDAMGQVSVTELNLDGGALYDPIGTYRDVADEWNDWADRPRIAPVATPTETARPSLAAPEGVTDGE